MIMVHDAMPVGLIARGLAAKTLDQYWPFKRLFEQPKFLRDLPAYERGSSYLLTDGSASMRDSASIFLFVRQVHQSVIRPDNTIAA